MNTNANITNIFQVSQAGVKNAVSKKVTLSFGEITCLVLGESGRGRERTLIPAPEGELRFVSDGLTKSGRPRLNTVAEHPNIIYLVWKFEAGFRGTTVPQIEHPNVTTLAHGYCAQGDAGRMGGHCEYLLKISGDCVLKCSIKGRIYKTPPEWVVIIEGGNVQVMTEEEYTLYLDTSSPSDVDSAIQEVQFANPNVDVMVQNDCITISKEDELPQVAGVFTTNQFSSPSDVEFAVQAIKFANPTAQVTVSNDCITISKEDELPQVAGVFTTHQFSSSSDLESAIQAVQFANPTADVMVQNDTIIVTCVRLINLTPHALNIQNIKGEIVTIPPSGMVARCEQINTPLPPICGISLVSTTFGDVIDLPERKDYHILIASRIVLSALKGTRPDVVGVGEAIRNEKGEVIGSKNLSI